MPDPVISRDELDRLIASAKEAESNTIRLKLYRLGFEPEPPPAERRPVKRRGKR